MKKILKSAPLQTAVTMVSLLMLTACNTSDKTEAKHEKERTFAPESSKVYIPELWPKRAITPAKNTEIENRIQNLLEQMSVEEKVGQLIQAELRHVTPEDVKKYHLGSILNGGGTTPNNDKYASIDDWVQLAEAFYQASMDTSDGRVAIPLIWGSDALHGNNNVYGATIFPHNIGLGAARDPDLIKRIGEITALEVAVTGVSWTFGPTVAVARDVRWGRTYESYSEQPELVAEYAGAMVQGIQGDSEVGKYDPDSVFATAKHFIGDGGTRGGIDRGDTQLSEKKLFEDHAAGYMSALDSDVLSAMASFNSWNGDRIHGHKYLLTDILKGRLGFDGFVVSDWNGHMYVEGCTVTRCAPAIEAGVDLVMVTEEWKAFYENTVEDARSGALSMARLDDAVSRILRVKLRRGLFEAGSVLARKNVGDESLFGSKAHREVAREAVRKSLVLLKNNNNVLPVSPKANVLLVGDAANNIGKQSGGWTLSWQGTGNSNDDFPGASSIYDGLNEAITAAGGQLVLSETGEWDENSFANGAKPDVVIAVYGEEPYAEWHGDIANIEYQQTTKTDLALLSRLKAQGLPVVSVFITGRPLWTNKELNQSDAFVAAWLPGSEGQGVADVLLKTAEGDINYDFVGKLSFSWPQFISQTGLDTYSKDSPPLFPYGYGLTYSDTSTVSNDLTEDGIDHAKDGLEDMWVLVSRDVYPWQSHLQDKDAELVAVTGNHASSGPDANLVMTAIDRSTQEDARRLVWSGETPSRFAYIAKQPQDLTHYYQEQSELNFRIKVDQYPTEAVSLSLDCQQGCDSAVDFAELLKAQPISTWSQLSIDLSCFIEDASELKEVNKLFVLDTEGSLDMSFSDLKLIPKSRLKETLGNRLSCD